LSRPSGGYWYDGRAPTSATRVALVFTGAIKPEALAAYERIVERLDGAAALLQVRIAWSPSVRTWMSLMGMRGDVTLGSQVTSAGVLYDDWNQARSTGAESHVETLLQVQSP
jgi:hypothetical protein